MYRNIGLIYERLGDIKKGQECIEKAGKIAVTYYSEDSNIRKDIKDDIERIKKYPQWERIMILNIY